ncbi:hypothetical protein V5F63_25050 [Xanthobacter autotrophicus DSM 597]|uniref:hypothetical protein n=1 Tax=Xanthobacter wiegelii TaxID=3119913 RepID=UPI003726C79D
MTWGIGVAVDTGVRILRQPKFGGLAALDEVQQLDIFAEMLEHVHHPDGRSFDHLEDQVTGDGMGAHHGARCRIGRDWRHEAVPGWFSLSMAAFPAQ